MSYHTLSRRLLPVLTSSLRHSRLPQCISTPVNNLVESRDHGLAHYSSSNAAREYVINSPHADIELSVLDAPMTSLTHSILDEFGKYSKTTALVDGVTGREVSYSELQTLIVKVSSSLVRLGLVSKGTVVTLYSPNCIEFVITYLAIVAAGGIVSPINAAYTTDEVVHAMSLVQSSLLFTTQTLLPVAQQAMQQCPHVKELIVFGECSEAGCRPFSSLITDDMSHFPDNINLSPREDPAAILFSSGTTGLPKGAVLTHYSLRAAIAQIRSPYGLNVETGIETISGVIPFFHIYGQGVVMLTGLACGAKIVTLPKFDPMAYLQTIQKHKVTYLLLVPPIMLFLAQHPVVNKFDLSSLRKMICGAAPLANSTVELVQQRVKQADIRQGSGMTEIGPVTNVHMPGCAKKDTVGPALHNTQFKIVDVKTGKSLGPGQSGEIYFRGPQMMKGYYNNEKATKETIDSDGWLHTGDLGRYDEDHHLILEDRIKELIKVKGFQVAPAELEAVLLRHESVQDAAVIGQYVNERVGELPTAFIVLKPEHNATQQQIQQFVAEHVAAYKRLTGGVVFCSEIPKAPSGKILRRLLRQQIPRTQETTEDVSRDLGHI